MWPFPGLVDPVRTALPWETKVEMETRTARFIVNSRQPFQAESGTSFHMIHRLNESHISSGVAHLSASAGMHDHEHSLPLCSSLKA